MLTWRPRGRIFPSADVPEWIGSYAAAPFAVAAGDREARVFFSGRDHRNRGQIGACTLDLEQMTVASHSVTAEPLVASGPSGSFDESGCTMSCIVRSGERWFLYYTGWMLGGTVPFYLAVGLAVSNDGGRTFHKESLAPVLDRDAVDPFLTASPSILVEDGLWRMWYVSAMEWQQSGDGARPRYLIKYAESRDGVRWRRDGRIAVGFESPDEHAMGRPHVIKDGSVYRMWFCVRGDRYRLAYAESDDGMSWRRRDFAPVPRQDWDSEMQAYPMVFEDRGRWQLLYNGNGYGATGFGCATSESIS